MHLQCRIRGTGHVLLERRRVLRRAKRLPRRGGVQQHGGKLHLQVQHGVQRDRRGLCRHSRMRFERRRLPRRGGVQQHGRELHLQVQHGLQIFESKILYSPSLSPSLYPSIPLSLYPSVPPFLSSSVPPSVRPSVPPSVRLSGRCPPVHLSRPSVLADVSCGMYMSISIL